MKYWRLNVVGVIAMLGCSIEDAPLEPGGCVPPDDALRSAWSAVMGTRCLACHTSEGVAKHSKLVLQPSSRTGYEAQNLETVRAVSRYSVDGSSVLLMKPTARVSHGGGAVVVLGSPEYQAIERLVQSLESECSSSSVAPPSDFFKDVALLDARGTFRRAAIVLAGRVPSDAETARLDAEGDAALAEMVRALLTEAAFYDRLAEAWNDRLLTDKYDRWEEAVNLLREEDFPDRRWWLDEDYPVNETERALGERWANHAVAREPLTLITEVVRQDRPFTDVVTADNILVNPFSARVYGVFDSIAWTDPTDPAEWHPATLPGRPTAGLLTSPMVLNRFPTTDTNRNRARSRLVWDLFLATDVMQVAERPIDPTGIEAHNPTMFTPSCAVCHELLDPIAGTFAAWDAGGRFLPPENGWYGDMRPPGFGAETVPYGEESKGLPWLGQRVASDPRFATAAVRTAYTLLTGLNVVSLPTEEEALVLGAEAALERRRTSEAQSRDLEAIAKAFAEGGFKFKDAVVALALSPWFRMASPRADIEDAALRGLSNVGPGRILTPEELDRKIASVVGAPWTGWEDRHPLLQNDGYRLFYGGIDSDAVTRRITSPSGLMASVQERMANEVACQATARDFLREDRVLFPKVEREYEPEDVNEFDVPEAQAAIRDNLRHLIERFLGDRLADGDPELEALYDLWFEVWREGRARVLAGDEEEHLRWECQARHDPATGKELPEADRIEHDANYTVRAWMAVVTVLLSDYQFLYE